MLCKHATLKTLLYAYDWRLNQCGPIGVHLTFQTVCGTISLPVLEQIVWTFKYKETGSTSSERDDCVWNLDTVNMVFIGLEIATKCHFRSSVCGTNSRPRSRLKSRLMTS